MHRRNITRDPLERPGRGIAGHPVAEDPNVALWIAGVDQIPHHVPIHVADRDAVAETDDRRIGDGEEFLTRCGGIEDRQTEHCNWENTT